MTLVQERSRTTILRNKHMYCVYCRQYLIIEYRAFGTSSTINHHFKFTPTDCRSYNCMCMERSRSPPFSPPYKPPQSLGKDSSINGTVSPSAGTIQPQPQQSVATVATDVLGSLPTITRTTGHRVSLVEDDIEEFLKRDLDVSRLNSIHGYLWMAGRPLNARPLQRQKMMGFDVILTDQMDLHLLKFSHRLLIKPLPEYILNYNFWKEYLCESKEQHESASGLLLSYVWLICSPMDMKIAHELDVLPSDITWSWWKTFVTDFVSHIDVNALDQVNRRFHFGELRLGRINSIYRIRFFFTHFIRGYLYGYNRYVVFFERKFAWVLGVFIYFSLVLSAMQVGLTVPPLNSNQVFQRASHGFVIFSIIVVVFFLGFLGILFASIFLFNMMAAILHSRRKRLEREQLARKREEKRAH